MTVAKFDVAKFAVAKFAVAKFTVAKFAVAKFTEDKLTVLKFAEAKFAVAKFAVAKFTVAKCAVVGIHQFFVGYCRQVSCIVSNLMFGLDLYLMIEALIFKQFGEISSDLKTANYNLHNFITLNVYMFCRY